jgi:hypothetical protein
VPDKPMSERLVRQQQVLVLGGAMRSGTTIIHRALCTAVNSNPYISESWFLRDIMSVYKWSLPRYDLRLGDQFGSVQNFQRLMRINVQYYVSMVSARYGDPDVLILKHPELIKYFMELGFLFPDFHFLGIVRDPRDVIASIKRIRDKQLGEGASSPVTSLGSVSEMCAYYAGYYTQALKYVSKTQLRLEMVRYEDVMRDPRAQIAAIGEACGARYDLDTVQSFDEGRTASSNLDKDFRMEDAVSSAFWSDLYRKDLSSERIGRYPESLTPDEIAEIEERLGEIGRAFDYW